MEDLTKKQKQIIDTAKELFWRYGLKRVTVEEICTEASVSKVTFYKYYKNKTELAKALMKYFIEQAMQHYNSIMQNNNSYPEKVRRIIDMKLEFANNMSKEFLTDLYSADSELAKYIQEFAQKNLQNTLSDFIEAQQRGDIRKDVNPRFMIYFLNKMTEMIEDKELLNLYNNVSELTNELTSFFFYGVLAQKNEN